MIPVDYVEAAARVELDQHAARARLEQLMAEPGSAHHLARAQACLDDAEEARRRGDRATYAVLAAMARDHETIAAALIAAHRRCDRGAAA